MASQIPMNFWKLRKFLRLGEKGRKRKIILNVIIAKQKFEDGIKHMRSLMINNYTYVRSYMIPTIAGGRGRVGSSLVNAGSSLDSL